MSPSETSKIDFSTFYNIVDGRLRDATAVYSGTDPATKTKLWDTPVATEQDLDAAVEAAGRAFPAWSKTSFEERSRRIHAFSEEFIKHKQEFVSLLIKENGRPVPLALWEVETVPEFLHHYASLTLPEVKFEEEEKTIVVRHVPLGVVGAICPWNLPIFLCIVKIAPALMAGNCAIVKPSYVLLAIVEIAQAFFPPGVLQALGGDDRLGPWIVNHPGIQKISFTGSVATGKKVMEGCAKTMKRLTLELGGNDACIVCPDVDIKKAAAGVAFGSFFNSGQGCVVAKRIYVHEDIYTEFLKEFVAASRALKVGPGSEEGVMVGPIQNAMQYGIVQDYVEDSHANGHKFALGGRAKESEGYFVEPTIIDNPPNDSKIITGEPFGPIVPVQPWVDEGEVIRRANSTDTGLGGSVWSKDLQRAERIARQMDTGTVWINKIAEVDPKAVFSGHKSSGLGTEYGMCALESYSNVQSLIIYQ